MKDREKSYLDNEALGASTALDSALYACNHSWHPALDMMSRVYDQNVTFFEDQVLAMLRRQESMIITEWQQERLDRQMMAYKERNNA